MQKIDILDAKKTPRREACGALKDGAGDEIRTRDNHVGNVALYQLSYSCVDSGFKGGGFNRQAQRRS